MKAEIITIGDEILNGQIVDTNSSWIAQQLALAQVSVVQMSSISDKEDIILGALTRASERADLVIVTGGLGPTRDDVTRQAISVYFDSPIVRNMEVLNHVENIFKQSGLGTMPTMNLNQADVLKDAKVLFNDVGTAPGMWLEKESVCYAFLPGVPFEMKYLIENRVMPLLLDEHKKEFVYNAHLITVGLGESHLAERIADLEDALPPYIKLAYLPRLGLVRLRFTASGINEAVIKKETDGYADLVAERLNEHVVAREDITLEEVIVRTFSEHKTTLSTAESCTGGTFSAAITAIPGASNMFVGGAVAYANSAKLDLLDVNASTLTNYGAVSEETVVEMALGAQKKFKSDYAIATSGVAGPGGGTDKKPVGMVCVAVVGPQGKEVKTFYFKNDRAINIERTVSAGLQMLWRMFKKQKY